MGSGVSCLDNLTQTWPLVKRGKNRIIRVKAKEPAKEVKICKYCHCQNEECRLKKKGGDSATSEKFRTVKCGTGNESIFVNSSDFPFRRPKTITVKPFRSDGKTLSSNKTSTLNTQTGELGKEYSPQKIYGFYPYDNLQRLTLSEPSYFRRQPSEHPREEELARSASYNPPNVASRPIGSVLPHRTVERLKNLESYRIFHETYPSVIFTEQVINSSHSHKRPPTPVPWYPPERTNDFLVASSMLAAEQESRRRMQ